MVGLSSMGGTKHSALACNQNALIESLWRPLSGTLAANLSWPRLSASLSEASSAHGSKRRATRCARCKVCQDHFVGQNVYRADWVASCVAPGDTFALKKKPRVTMPGRVDHDFAPIFNQLSAFVGGYCICL